MGTGAIINQIIIAGIIIIVGVIGARVGVIDKDARDRISKLVFNITLPLLIFSTFATMKLNSEIINNGFWVLIFSNITMFLAYIIGLLSVRLHRLNTPQIPIHILHTMFGNIVFLGFPLIKAIYPQQEGILFASLFYFVSSYILWTFGVMLLKNEKDTSWQERLKNLLNPNTIAFILGIGFMAININIPFVIIDPLKGIGSTTTYLALLYIGALLATTNLKGIYKRTDIYLLNFNKLLLVPLLILLIINVFISFFNIHISDMAKTIIVLQAGMPCMSSIVILAYVYGADDKAAAENLFVSTILSLATLPLLFTLSNTHF